MAEKNVVSGFPVEGGADEKLAYLTKQISPAELKSTRPDKAIYSLNIQVDEGGRQLVAGFRSAQVNPDDL